MPVLESELISAFSGHIPPLLSSASTGLIPQTIHGLINIDPAHPPSTAASPGSRQGHGLQSADAFARTCSPMSSSSAGMHDSRSDGFAMTPDARPGELADSPTHPARGGSAGTGLSVHNKRETIRRRSLGKEGISVVQLKPLSSTACDVVLSTIKEGFSMCGGVAATDEQARACIVAVSKAVDGLLLKSLKRTQDEMDDIVYYGDIACKDWMAGNTLW
jgi:hypothetical protein